MPRDHAAKKPATSNTLKIALVIFIFIIANELFLPFRVGKASWYSRNSPGINRRTANNEKFNDQDMTCAIWGMPFNARVLVINIFNGKSIMVRVNDRGPHERFVLQGRVIDLTKAAFEKISPPKKGLVYVVVIRVF